MQSKPYIADLAPDATREDIIATLNARLAVDRKNGVLATEPPAPDNSDLRPLLAERPDLLADYYFPGPLPGSRLLLLAVDRLPGEHPVRRAFESVGLIETPVGSVAVIGHVEADGSRRVESLADAVILTRNFGENFGRGMLRLDLDGQQFLVPLACTALKYFAGSALFERRRPALELRRRWLAPDSPLVAHLGRGAWFRVKADSSYPEEIAIVGCRDMVTGAYRLFDLAQIRSLGATYRNVSDHGAA